MRSLRNAGLSKLSFPAGPFRHFFVNEISDIFVKMAIAFRNIH